ncbi:hypothetical protein CAEBREN_14444 [Caenorhabditis brenneri]|uniref:Uncharacterized protein n=1 Tax=Caenorhabditis brenneri TaxID=135651 RepID=G0N2D6_CAEBE|nr:hypothetical protein CAEBREN_14444 [Caenorhabditis brenneri]
MKLLSFLLLLFAILAVSTVEANGLRHRYAGMKSTTPEPAKKTTRRKKPDGIMGGGIGMVIRNPISGPDAKNATG